MCGRYATTRESVDLAELFEALDESEGGVAVDYNVAPTDPVPIVRVADGARVLRVARWGLVPHWAPDARGAARMINARAETVITSTAYGPAFAHRRCLIPADGWYEWTKGPDGRQAHYLTSAGGDVLCFAGLYARWQDLLTCTILTTAAAGPLVAVHHRMPLLLPRSRWARWLDGPAGADLLEVPDESFLERIEIRPVGPAVGDVRNDGPGLVTPVRAPDEPPLTLF